MCYKLSTTLYHGTVSDTNRVNVSLGKGRKDFGRGFYMAVSRQPAMGMMHKKYREAVRRSRQKNEAVFSENLYQIALNESVL